MEIKVRKFQVSDARRLVQILQLNGQYDDPEIEGETAMKRVAACGAALIFVAEIDARPCGFIKAVYDGSRALIHLLSIHPDYQRCGIGSVLVDAVSAEFLQRGAPTVSVTASRQSVRYWETLGFEFLPVVLMLKKLK